MRLAAALGGTFLAGSLSAACVLDWEHGGGGAGGTTASSTSSSTTSSTGTTGTGGGPPCSTSCASACCDAAVEFCLVNGSKIECTAFPDCAAHDCACTTGVTGTMSCTLDSCTTTAGFVTVLCN
ncbi:MAG: hypothetical protein IT373_35755 [Polyangiaceae bacterium]|nr:hypothetical protein [Polyangiaceae bacterium]